jgi:excinuclease ABC subunit A
MDKITVHGARQHNLKNITVAIPRFQLTVFTGVSGSGKSSLAFDTIFSEGYRRYVEAISNQSRQFLQHFEAPEVDAIEGLTPTIALQQSGYMRNPRSTVGTLTEIHDFLRVLYSTAGTCYCPDCHQPVFAHTIPEMVQAVYSEFPANSRLHILAPLGDVSQRDLPKVLQRLSREGYARVRVNDTVYELDPRPLLPRRTSYQLQVVVDRVILQPEKGKRLRDSLELASKVGAAVVGVQVVGGKTRLFSESWKCVHCTRLMPALTPSLFSFNHPEGACPECRGLGFQLPARSSPSDQSPYNPASPSDFPHHRLSDDLPNPRLGEKQVPCPYCTGSRFNLGARAVRLGEMGIHEVSQLPLAEFKHWLASLPLTEPMSTLLAKPVSEIMLRLRSLEELSLEYLTLGRSAISLSGGELQRIRLARQLGPALSGILYVLDEPSVGLHPRDQQRLLNLLFQLRDVGNTILVVEHDKATIQQADHVVELGPGAGVHGGNVVFSGSPSQLIHHPSSLTGRYLSGLSRIQRASRFEPFTRGALRITDACGHNLKQISVAFPIGCLTCVTGVSGSGKTTLVIHTLFAALRQLLYRASTDPAPFGALENSDLFHKVICVDQSPLGKTTRSTPATYTGLMSSMRRLFSQLPEARARGYGPNRFSFNIKGGRCESCKGEGVQRVPMAFMPDAYIKCSSCQGSRYHQDTLDILFKGHSIADVLNKTIIEAAGLFENIPVLKDKLARLIDVGLGYLQLGQSARTLSGGEAQRVKLGAELARKATGDTLFILDEPTTGLHFEDIQRLLNVLDRLLEQGNTVVLIEHHPDVIGAADYVIDLGPEGGKGGGSVVAAGTPREIAANRDSHTGRTLQHGDFQLVRNTTLRETQPQVLADR